MKDSRKTLGRKLIDLYPDRAKRVKADRAEDEEWLEGCGYIFRLSRTDYFE